MCIFYILMADRYWRQEINSVKDNIENSMQISNILSKLKEYDEKLDDLSKIGNNENNISSHLSKIGDNEIIFHLIQKNNYK